MTKEEKKKALIAAGLVGALIILWLLMKKSGRYNPVVNGAGQPAGTSYLTYNIPPINSSGYAIPDFGDVVIQAGNPAGNGGGCGGCDAVSYYGTSAQLAAGLAGSEQYANYQDALSEALNNFNVTTSYTVNPGSLYVPPPADNSVYAPPVLGNV